MRVLAGLYRPVEAETPYGGRAVTYEPVGSAWLRCGARRRREGGAGDERHAVEIMTAEARSDPRLQTGRVLRFAGSDWAVVTADDLRPGRVTLGLERVR